MRTGMGALGINSSAESRRRKDLGYRAEEDLIGKVTCYKDKGTEEGARESHGTLGKDATPPLAFWVTLTSMSIYPCFLDIVRLTVGSWEIRLTFLVCLIWGTGRSFKA